MAEVKFLRNKKTGGIFMVKDGEIVKEKNNYDIKEENRNFGDYSYNSMYIKDNNDNIIALLEYAELHDMKKSDIYKSRFGNKKVSVIKIGVDKNYRRKGIATNLYKKLQGKYPNQIIRFGNLTDDGLKLIKNIGTITNYEIPEGRKEKVYYGYINK